jgi:hypothetical protein
MLDPLGSGLTWQQFLALGLVAAFVGAVRRLRRPPLHPLKHEPKITWG